MAQSLGERYQGKKAKVRCAECSAKIEDEAGEFLNDDNEVICRDCRDSY